MKTVTVRTCYVLNGAAVSLSYIFGRAVSILRTKKGWRESLGVQTGNQLFAIQSDMSRQRLLAHRRSAAIDMSLCITIRFVLLLTTIFHYDMICPAAENSFLLR